MTIEPKNQDIFIVAHPRERLESAQGTDPDRHPEGAQDLIIAGVDGNIYHVNKKDWKKNRVDLKNPPENNEMMRLPEEDRLKINQLIGLRSVLAHIPLGVPKKEGTASDQATQLPGKGGLNAIQSTERALFDSPGSSGPTEPLEVKRAYYLANFALLNTPERDPSSGKIKPVTLSDSEAELYYVPKAEWKKERLCPGDSVFVLEMLQRGTTIAYIPTTARTMDCVCYLLNLASLNDITVFEPSAKGQSCQRQVTSDEQTKSEEQTKK
ncbi:hypothetical protein [Sorangium sp. So ce406]|uniref:hypothetical protein n=1 Tax=Sorangium sp. So ce406 TaxID=3133311 RepID=UPI003F5AE2B1